MPHLLELTMTGMTFAMEALAAEIVVELVKSGTEHFHTWIILHERQVVVQDEEGDEIELSQTDIQILQVPDDDIEEPGGID